MNGRWRRAAARGLAIAAIASSFTPAAATVHVHGQVPAVELAGHTLLHWRGSVAVRIHASKDVRFPDNGGVRLMSHGHYAFVRVDPTTACEFDSPHCGTGMIDWTPAISDGLDGPGYAAHHGGAGTDISYAIQDPEGLSHGWSVLYLASDGDSTLELTTPDLRGRRDVRLTYRAPIVVQRLAASCNAPAEAACDPHSGYASRLVFGGATHDVGKSGFAQVVVINAEGSDQARGPAGAANSQPLGVVGCVYGPGMSISEDPDPSAHATGCDVAPKPGGEPDTVEAAQLTLTSINPAVTGQAFWRGDGHRSGPTYLGYIMDSPLSLPHPKWQEAWGIWFPYLTS